MFLGILAWLFVAAAACFNPDYRGGTWSDLGALAVLVSVFPVIGVICCVLALFLLRLRLTRAQRVFGWSAVALAFILGCPLINVPLAVGMSLPAALVLKPMKDALDKPYDPPPQRVAWPRPEGRFHARAPVNRNPRTLETPDLPIPKPPPPEPPPDLEAINRQYRTLGNQFARPQKVARAANGLLVLGDRKVLRLYGVHMSYENSVDLSNLTSGHLVDRQVMIRLPDRDTFANLYRPAGDGFGTIPAYVYVDGVLLNARYKTTPGSMNDFGEYEKAPAPLR